SQLAWPIGANFGTRLFQSALLLAPLAGHCQAERFASPILALQPPRRFVKTGLYDYSPMPMTGKNSSHYPHNPVANVKRIFTMPLSTKLCCCSGVNSGSRF